MYKIHYRFDTIAAMAERMTTLRVGRSNSVVGVRTLGVFGGRLGSQARRYYPFGALVVLPDVIPRSPWTEQQDEDSIPPDTCVFPEDPLF